MPRIKAFQALRPAPGFEAQVASVPYDVVSRDEAAALARGNPLSFLHVVRPDIDFPPDQDPYDPQVYRRAAENFQRLQADGVLIRDTQPSLFAYRQTMAGRSQTGIVCCCHIDDYENNLILKHEKTRQAKEDDRTRHTLALNANAGPVFLACRDVPRVNSVITDECRAAPLYDFTAVDGIRHTVWRITDSAACTSSLSAVAVFYVADGHHRAASAWRAGVQRKQASPQHTGQEEYNWFLTVLFPAGELRILPYNRILRDLNGLTPRQLLERLRDVGTVTATSDPNPPTAGSFAVFVDDRWWLVTFHGSADSRNAPAAALDVALLEDRVLRPIFGIGDVRSDARIDFVGGIRGTGELETLVRSGAWAVGISMYPTSVEQLMAVADAGQIMPPKSTWFEPKLRSGLLVHTLD